MPNNIRIDVNSGTVKQDLAMLPKKMLEIAYEELLQQAELMKGLAQVFVRVDTGSLRDSIRIERTAPEHELHRKVSVRAGGYVTNPKTHRKVDYAVIVEQKYPYMRPAFEQVRGNIASLIERRVVEEVNR